jgi:hypothetical protein
MKLSQAVTILLASVVGSGAFLIPRGTDPSTSLSSSYSKVVSFTSSIPRSTNGRVVRPLFMSAVEEITEKKEEQGETFE